MLLLTHVSTKFEVKVEVHGEDLEIPYEDGVEQETYLCALWRLLWVEADATRAQPTHAGGFEEAPMGKVGGHLDDHRFIITFSSIIMRGFETFEVTPRRWLNWPMPEHRAMELRQSTFSDMFPVASQGRDPTSLTVCF